MIERVSLGQSGITTSQLCFGTGTNGWQKRSNQGDLGLERLSYLLRFGHELGITFWDTADQYGTHAHVAAALSEVERDSVTVTTKTVSRTPEEVRADVERFRRELNTDYIDIVLLHCLTEADWPTAMAACMDVLSDFKAAGTIRAVGCSCHDFGALQAAEACAWVDVNLVRINYAGQAMCASPQEVLRVIDAMASSGQGVYGMKIVGGGADLTADPQRAIRYALETSAVHAIVLGMIDENEIRQNAGFVAELAPA